VTALGPDDVWVFGGPGADPGVGTWHFNGHSWTQITSAPGNGIVTASSAVSGLLAIHRSATGSWSRTTIGPNASMLRLTLIPGTTSLWGVGSAKSTSTSGVNAAVWAHGRVG